MDYIKIKGYKSIKEATIPLKEINILIGANGAGKSNFISFFEFLNNIYNRKLREYVGLRGGEEKILYKGSSETNYIKFKVEFDKGQNGYSATIVKADEGFIFNSEFLIYKGSEGRNISHYNPESRVKATDNYRAKYVIKYLDGLRSYHFHDTGRKSPFNKMSHIDNDSYFLYERGDNLAAYLFSIRENHQIAYNRIIKTIQTIAPFFSDFFFQANKEGYIRLQWEDKYSSTIYGVNDLSDGTLRFMALCTLFLQPNLPSSIIIDEPELGLHPFATAKLAGMIQSAAARGVQVILATQSSDLVNHFEAEDIITVDQRNGESHFNRLNEKDLSQWLDDYSIGDLWQRNIIHGGQPG